MRPPPGPSRGPGGQWATARTPPPRAPGGLLPCPGPSRPASMGTGRAARLAARVGASAARQPGRPLRRSPARPLHAGQPGDVGRDIRAQGRPAVADLDDAPGHAGGCPRERGTGPRSYGDRRVPDAVGASRTPHADERCCPRAGRGGGNDNDARRRTGGFEIKITVQVPVLSRGVPLLAATRRARGGARSHDPGGTVLASTA